MLASTFLIGIIFVALFLGYIASKFLSTSKKKTFVGLISKIVLLLLFMMGLEIGWVFFDGKISNQIFIEAFLLALLISLVVFLLIIRGGQKKYNGIQTRSFILPIIDCTKAISFFVAGVFAYRYTGVEVITSVVGVNEILYLLVFLVGIDLGDFNLKAIDLKHLKIPLLTVCGTLLACCLFSFFSDRSLQDIFLVSSGQGWFTLSGPMISSLKGPELGMFAFLTDMFREMFSIIFLYLLGGRYSHSAIGISGAAALDSILPFIKENCHSDDLKYAISSGFILTLVAPILITVFASF